MDGIVKMIEDVLYRKDMSKAKLAMAVGMPRQNFQRKMDSGDLSLTLLTQISVALNHNFLYDMAKAIKVKFDAPGMDNITIDDLISYKINKALNENKPRPYRAVLDNDRSILNEPDAKPRTDKRR